MKSDIVLQPGQARYKIQVMKKIIWILAAALMLGGCQPQAATTTFTTAGFSITLPSSFSVQTAPGYAAGYADDDVIVLVSTTTRAQLSQRGLDGDMTIDDYAGLLVSSFDVGSYTAFRKSGFDYFTYTAYVLDDYFYYTVAVYATAEAFWSVSFSCLFDVRAAYKDKMVSWARTVSVD